MVEINLTIDEIKAHLNLDHDLDDELLEAYKVATLEVCQKHIGKTFGEEETEKTILFTQKLYTFHPKGIYFSLKKYILSTKKVYTFCLKRRYIT